MKVAILTLLLLIVAINATTIDPLIQVTLKNNFQVNILVTLKSGTTSVFNSLNLQNRTFKNRGDKLNTIVSALKSHAASSQRSILDFLSKSKSETLEVKIFWISNQIYIRGANKSIVDKLAGFEEISIIAQEKTVPRDILFPALKNRSPKYQDKATTADDITWGLSRIRADQVWNSGINGTNIVVATIDTGVRGTHEALKDNYLGNYGWYEPKGEDSRVPTDENGHGSHTTGTIAGSHGVGVAPGAKWMACRICMTGEPECYLPDLISCGQFFMCPTEWDGVSNPDCSKAPHVINNSWGHLNDDGWSFDAVIDAWLAGGIVPVFSIGNGNQCHQTIYPGDKENVIGVGGSTEENLITSVSSRGPNQAGHIKPDITAPGAYIKSASSDGDGLYKELSGTSMASPHIAGVAALLLSYKPDLTVDQIKEYLYDGASIDFVLTGDNCDNIVETRVPNNAFGYGIVDAYRSLELLRADFPTVV